MVKVERTGFIKIIQDMKSFYFEIYDGSSSNNCFSDCNDVMDFSVANLNEKNITAPFFCFFDMKNTNTIYLIVGHIILLI